MTMATIEMARLVIMLSLFECVNALLLNTHLGICKTYLIFVSMIVQYEQPQIRQTTSLTYGHPSKLLRQDCKCHQKPTTYPSPTKLHSRIHGGGARGILLPTVHMHLLQSINCFANNSFSLRAVLYFIAKTRCLIPRHYCVQYITNTDFQPL